MKTKTEFNTKSVINDKKTWLMPFLFNMAIMLISIMSFSQSLTFTSDGIFLVPVGVTNISVKVWGGGGGGGYVTTNGGGGGGGGGYSEGTVSVNPGEILNVIIGSGGAGGNIGSNGENSSFSTITAYGGQGGQGITGGSGGSGSTINGNNGSNNNAIWNPNLTWNPNCNWDEYCHYVARGYWYYYWCVYNVWWCRDWIDTSYYEGCYWGCYQGGYEYQAGSGGAGATNLNGESFGGGGGGGGGTSGGIPGNGGNGQIIISWTICNSSTVPTLSTSSSTNCGTQATTLSIATGLLNSATAWQWYSGSCGGTSIGSGSSVVVSPAMNTTYYARGEGGCTAPGSCESITIAVNPLPNISSTMPASRNGRGTLILGATASSGIINWYAVPTGGISLGTGTSFMTPSISSTTIYYVDATYNGCTSARTAVIASIVCVIVNIPDTNLKAALVAMPFINTNGDGEIDVCEAAGYNGVIYVFGSGISDMTGIEAFTAITGLDCSNNLLSSLDVSQNTALWNLDCYGNSLNSLILGHNTSLNFLNCSNNNLSSLDISNTTTLGFLSCAYNSLISLNISNNHLGNLYCPNNLLSNLDVSSNTSLGYLNCSYNSLISLNVANGNDTYLYLETNNNPNLTCIQVDNAAWSTANWTVGGGNIDATASFSLNCNSSACTAIVNIPDTNLKAALVAMPFINTNGDGEIQVCEAEAYKEGINVFGYGITDMTGIEAFTAITGLDCAENSLSSLDVSHNTALNILGCTWNSITSLDVSHNISLMHLDCSNNSLSSLNISNNTLLMDLYCNNNSLSNLDVSANTWLSLLDCSNNSLIGLNVANGNNTSFWGFNATINPNLTCIQVDNVPWSTTNWTVGNGNIVAISSFSLNCSCINPGNGGSIINNQTISGGTIPSGITNVALPVGAIGTIEYQWQQSTISNNSGFTDIVGANTDSYNPGILNVTTWYKRLARVNCMSDWTGAVASNTVEITVNSSTKVLTARVLIEGLYAGNGMMNQAQSLSGAQYGEGVADKITVELHNATAPYEIAYTFSNINLNTNGTSTISDLPGNISGNYYIVIKHRNSIETWSNDVFDFTGAGPFSYDFFNAAAKAFGNNMKQIAGAIFVLYGGDASQDGVVDGTDMALIDNSSRVVMNGYYPEDINGDGVVDGSDMAVIDNNSRIVVLVIRPY